MTRKQLIEKAELHYAQAWLLHEKAMKSLDFAMADVTHARKLYADATTQLHRLWRLGPPRIRWREGCQRQAARDAGTLALLRKRKSK